MAAIRKGLLIAYYGQGKGKTTAALGIALRSLGAGFNVYMLQFIKGDPSADDKAGAVTMMSAERGFAKLYKPQAGLGRFVIKAAGSGFVGIMGDQLDRSEHQAKARAALSEAAELIANPDKWQVVILDEILRAVQENLVSEDELIALLDKRSDKQHIVITGHEISDKLSGYCDLISQVKKIKHPFDQGILAQPGIDY